MFICALCKKIRSKGAILKKIATRTPVSTKQTNRVASKNHTSGRDKKNFLSDLISMGLREKHTDDSDQNSEKNFSVLAGLTANEHIPTGSWLQNVEVTITPVGMSVQ
jgi:hypothetical protein